MTIRKFSTAFLDNVLETGRGMQAHDIHEKGKWSVVWRLIFEFEGKSWMVFYEQPSRELQDCERWITGMNGEVSVAECEGYAETMIKYRQVTR